MRHHPEQHAEILVREHIAHREEKGAFREKRRAARRGGRRGGHPVGHDVDRLAADVEMRANVVGGELGHRRDGRGSVWMSGGSDRSSSCTSWYVHESGKNHVLWPGFSASYWWAMRKPERRHFLPETAS